MSGIWPFGFLILLLSLQTVFANVEKVIFLGPSSLQTSQSQPNLEDLQLHALSPHQSILRTNLRAEFPFEGSKHGLASWILLEDLIEGQRYEVRICWAATQPTSFWLSTHELPEVFGSSELITSLAEYSATREVVSENLEDQEPSISNTLREPGGNREKLESVLFLQIYAAADYYTSNKTLMNNVPPVLVDIILDPFILNIFPKSLLPTTTYLVMLAVVAWFLANYIAKWLRRIATIEEPKKKT